MKGRNSETIKRAFARLAASEETVVKDGMRNMIKRAVEVALEMHDDKHRQHIEVGDTYGWILVHDGTVVDMEVTSTDRNEGKTAEMLKEKAARLPSEGWAGVVMAGLTPGYYMVVYEKNILMDTVQVTKDNFGQYFKKI